MPEIFLADALSVGRRLVADAIRHGGTCTWFGNHDVVVDGILRRRGESIGPMLFDGTAGVGWVLAKLARVVADRAMAGVAREALHHAIAAACSAPAANRIGLYDGLTGVAWTAIDAGQVLQDEALHERGVDLANVALDKVRSPQQSSLGLYGGIAGSLAGTMALAAATGDDRFLEASVHLIRCLLARVDEWTSRPADRSLAGLAQGASGVAMSLAAWARRTGDEAARDAVTRLLRLERQWFSPARGWYGRTMHETHRDEHYAASWCSGAAGIGLARLNIYADTADAAALADAQAAIHLIRFSSRAADSSICHGACGQIEMLLAGATIFGEATHLRAARTLGVRLVEQRRSAHEGDLQPDIRTGLAGRALTMLRLHDPSIPSPLFRSRPGANASAFAEPTADTSAERPPLA